MYHVNVSEVIDMVGQKAESLSTRGQLRIMEFVRKYMVREGGRLSAVRDGCTCGVHGVVWKANDSRIDGKAPCACACPVPDALCTPAALETLSSLGLGSKPPTMPPSHA